MIPALEPYDTSNRQLESHVRPKDWVAPASTKPYQFLVIGGGTAGLVAAVGASQLGARVALIERGLLGGDCLNVGCVPSKALIACARKLASLRSVEPYGVKSSAEVEIDFPAVMERMRQLRARISPHDSAERLKQLGVDVYFGTATFVSEREVDVDGRVLQFRKAVVATGTRPHVPRVAGLSEKRIYTNETIFSLESPPRHLLVFGGGPIGCELAQTFRAFGSKVTMLESGPRLLKREDEDVSSIVTQALKNEGVQVLCNVDSVSASDLGDGTSRIEVAGKVIDSVDATLFAAGRIPNVEHLNLAAAGVESNSSGIVVDDFLRSTNRRIFASGDVCSNYKFTHAADFLSRAVVQNALFAVGPLGRKRVSDLVVPWVTYTSPEVAHVGHNESSANASELSFDRYQIPFEEIDRSVLDGDTCGFVRILTHQGTGKIMGATIVAQHAGEMISQITMAMHRGIQLGSIASVMYPYPTASEAIRKLGDQFNRKKLTPRNRKLLYGLLTLNVGT